MDLYAYSTNIIIIEIVMNLLSYLSAELHLRFITIGIAHIYWASSIPKETHEHGYLQCLLQFSSKYVSHKSIQLYISILNFHQKN